MQDIQAVDVQVPSVAEIEALIAQATQSGYGDVLTINALCGIAGRGDLFRGFLSSKTSAAEVGSALMQLRVDEQAGTELSTAMMPGIDAKVGKDAGQGKARPWGEIWKALGFSKDK